MATLQPIAPQPDVTVGEKNLVKALPLKKPSTMAIWVACLDDLTGKDKISKSVQYFLRMLVSIDSLNNKRSYLQDEFSLKNLNDIKRIRTLTSIFNNFGKINQKLIRLLELLVIKLTKFLDALSVYRQLLRAGTLPFRFHRLFHQLKESLKILTNNGNVEDYTISLNKLTNYWVNWDMLNQLINLQYALADETILAFKINLIDKDTYKNILDIAEDHEVWSWFIMILLGLRKDFIRWNELSNEESQLVLNERVKSHTRKIVQQMKSNPIPMANLFTNSITNEDITITNRLRSIWDEKLIVLVDSVRLACDLVYDAPFVLRWRISNKVKPIHLLLGVFSGLLGFYKVWHAQREKLTIELNEKES